MISLLNPNGTELQAWWRAVDGGKKAAAILRSHGCDTVGKLYKYVVLAAATAASNPSTKTTSTSARNDIASLYTPLVETPALGNSAIGGRGLDENKGAVEAGGNWRQIAAGGIAGSKLQRFVRDEDLAVKISTLLLRLMFAFEDLRVSAWCVSQ